MKTTDKEEILKILTWNHALYVVLEDVPNKIVHYVMYPEMPTEEDIVSLYEELETDEEFGLTDKRIIVCHAPDELLEFFHTDIRSQFLGN